MINTGILLVSIVLLLSAIPFVDTAEAESHKISGYVVDASDVAISNVKVTLFDPDNGDIRSDVTDGTGYFSIFAPAGHYLISYSHPMYVTPTSLLQMKEKDTYLQFIHLTKIAGQDATLSGHIEDTNGNNARYPFVYLIDTDGTNDGQNLLGQPMGNTIMTRGDRNGDYTFDMAYAGTFDLVARVGSSNYYFGADSSITLAAGDNNAPDIIYNDWRDGRTITVIPLDGNNDPISNAEIIFYDSAKNMWNSTAPSPGSVSVPDGTYDLIVRAPGHQTHIEQFVVSKNQHYQVSMVAAMDSVSTTDVTFNDWDDVDFQSTVVNQFDHGVNFRTLEYGMFASGIIRYDIERFFGNGDGTLVGPEADLYENFLENTIGSDGDTTRNQFMVNDNDFDYTYSNYAVAFTEGSTDVRSTDTVQFDFTYDLTSDIGEENVYRVYYTLGRHVQEDVGDHYENATLELPDTYEVDWEKVCPSCNYVIHHDEDDTTVVYIDGYGDAEFHCRENVSPTPVIRMSDDFIPNDGMYIYRSNEYIEFNGTDSYDGSTYGKIMSYDWTFVNESVPNTNNTATAIRMFDEGTYTAVLNVTDNAGGSEETTIYFIVDDTPPAVDFSVDPGTVDQGNSENDMTRVFLNITTLDDLNGIFDKFSWEFGDENMIDIVVFEDRNVTYHYSDLIKDRRTGVNEYTFFINLTVWDKAGNEMMVQNTVKVNATVTPEAMFEVSDDLVPNDDMHVYAVGENITFNASKSIGEGSEIVKYTWDFDDGRDEVEGMTLNHSFAGEGMYNVILTVEDEFGATGTYNMTIYIDATAPTVVFDIEGAWMNNTWYFIDQWDELLTDDDYLLSLNATGTMDSGGVGPIDGLHNFSWSFQEPNKPGFKAPVAGDIANLATDTFFSFINTSAMNVTLNEVIHYYYTISLMVWDLAGNRGQAEMNIIVNDTEAPVSRFTYIDDFDQETEIELNGTTSSDNIGIEIFEWTIYFPNGTKDETAGSADMIYNYFFVESGEYTVVLNVTDAAGNNDTHDSIVKVNRIPRANLEVTADGIFYSKESIQEGDKIEILANITNVGDIEAWNSTVQFFFRKTLEGTETQIGDDFVFPDPLLPTETRLANVSWTAKESGQIVVKVKLVGADPQGNLQVEPDIDNNEAFQQINVDEDKDEFPVGWALGIGTIVVIIFVGALILWQKPEWAGIKNPKSGKKSRK